MSREVCDSTADEVAAATEGWIKWSGGECPVPQNAHVAVWLRSGVESWAERPADLFRWSHIGNSGDIVAYRLTPPAASKPVVPDFRTDPSPPMTLPTDSAERKEYPVATGVLAYFPAALAGVAKHSKAGNDKHNPGEPLHHARGKSVDHPDCIVRHLMDLADLLAAAARGQPVDGGAILTEADALAWRALALSQDLHERIGGAPLAPGAR